MHRTLRGSRIVLVLLVLLAAVACGATPAPPPEPSGPQAATHLAGIHSSDIAKVARIRGLDCPDARQEQGFTHWSCEARTPLLAYTVDYYGRVPGRVEYIRVVVAQSGAPKIEQAAPLITDIATLRYNEVDRAAAKAWVEEHLKTGGATTIGPVTFRLSGDLSRLVFEVKAPGSEW